MSNDELAPVILGGRYRLVERVGVGGMAVVWCGYDEVLHRRVAVKVVCPELATEQQFLHLLRAEARAAAGLSHPNITSVYDYGEDQSAEGAQPYLVMELLEGATLAAAMRAHPDGLGWRQAVTIAGQVSAGLAAAHARGIVHRDITPNNVMLTPDGAQILDFGISAVTGATDDDDDPMGTPDYVSPERVKGEEITPAADVYVLGVMLYRCLAGTMPWPPATSQRLTDHLYAPPAELPPIDGLPPEIAELCLRCMAKSPDDRPTSAELAAELAADLGLLTVPQTLAAAPTAPDESRTLVLAISAGRVGSSHALMTAQPAPPRYRRRPAAAMLAAATASALAAAIGLVAGVRRGSPSSHGR